MNKKFKNKSIPIILTTGLVIVLLSGSCITPKKVNYFQESKRKKDSVNLAFVQKESITANYEHYKIKHNDYLYIRVTSVDKDINDLFHFHEMQASVPTYSTQYRDIYLVNDSGMINFPYVGAIEVKGLTINQVKDSLNKSLSAQFSEFDLEARLAYFAVTILGEVTKPGQYTVERERTNILEVIGQAGDLTNYANRKQVLLLRKSASGTDVYEIDLTNRRIVESDLYYLRPDDVIFVKSEGASYLSARSYPFLTTVSIILSTFSSMIVILSALK